MRLFSREKTSNAHRLSVPVVEAIGLSLVLIAHLVNASFPAGQDSRHMTLGLRLRCIPHQG